MSFLSGENIIGRTVRSKSGGPIMVVRVKYDGEDRFECSWVDFDGEGNTQDFSLDDLEEASL